MSEAEIEELVVTIDEARSIVRKKMDILKLESNREFKRVILEGYFKEEAARVTSALADPTMYHLREQLQEQLIAISHFEQYLRVAIIMGHRAEVDIIEGEAEIDELREEAA